MQLHMAKRFYPMSRVYCFAAKSVVALPCPKRRTPKPRQNSASTSSLIRSNYHQFQISWPKTKLMAVTLNLTNHLPLKICNMEVQFVDSFTYLGTLIMNYSAMYGLSNPLFRKHMIIRTKINIQYVAPWLSPFC